MCGRYSDETESFSQLKLDFDVDTIPLRPRYNIAPSKAPGHEPVIVRNVPGSARAEALRARWWLIPSWWSKPLQQLQTTFNARIESAATKPTFRGAFAARHCLVPATGWREFVGGAGGKRPFRFHREEPFFFAGLWESWSPRGEAPVVSFTIVTAPASASVAPIHDRMPIVVPSDLQLPWLLAEGDSEQLLRRAARRQDDGLHVYEASPHGNSTRVDDPECIAPVSDQATGQLSLL